MMTKAKSKIIEILSRSFIHWRSSLLGAIEGSGIMTAAIISGNRETQKAALIISCYLFVKGLITKGEKK
jgi:hypothetical protein